MRTLVSGDSLESSAWTEAELQSITASYAEEGSENVPVSTAGYVADIDHLYLVPPLTGAVSQEFDQESNHLGVDVLAPANTPIKAVLDGYVIASDWTLETGNTIGIQHSGQLVSFYKHNARNLKKLGSFVKAGEAVAIIGNTGELSSGPHLHFEFWINGKPVNPSAYIDFE